LGHDSRPAHLLFDLAAWNLFFLRRAWLPASIKNEP
jgi:hypothetical protein